MANLTIGRARVRGARKGPRARVAGVLIAPPKRPAPVGRPAGMAAALFTAFGVVYLLGRLERDAQVDRLVRATRAIQGVKEVRSLLHTRSERA